MSSITRAPNSAPHGISQEDWDDVDSPEMTDAELAEMRPASEMPEEVYALLPKRGRGRPKSENPKVNVTLRLDPRLVEAYKATGPGWQTRMQEVLAKGIEPQTPAYHFETYGHAKAHIVRACYHRANLVDWLARKEDAAKSIEEFNMRALVKVHGRRQYLELVRIQAIKAAVKATMTKRPKRDHGKKAQSKLIGWSE